MFYSYSYRSKQQEFHHLYTLLKARGFRIAVFWRALELSLQQGNLLLLYRLLDVKSG